MTPFFLYLNWLQKENPVGEVERFPVLTQNNETSQKGIYCIGDLTGVPLINLAAESGAALVKRLHTASALKKRAADAYDLVIVGAGPAGVSAAMEADKLGMKAVVLESASPFATIRNFPAKKPIHIVESPTALSELTFTSKTKEALLDELTSCLDASNIDIRTGQSVSRIERKGDLFSVISGENQYRAGTVIVAIGKSGNPRRLNVTGENLEKVYSRLIDATQFHNRHALVVGGGDSAVEAAVSLAQAGNHVTLSYRKTALTRPKAANKEAIEKLAADGRVTLLLGTTVLRINTNTVVLDTSDGQTEIKNDIVFSLVGTEIPISFFNRSHIAIEGERNYYFYLKMVTFLLFAAVLYFGKSAPITKVSSVQQFFELPATLWQMPWHQLTKGMMSWLSFIGLGVATTLMAGYQLRHKRSSFSDASSPECVGPFRLG